MRRDRAYVPRPGLQLASGLAWRICNVDWTFVLDEKTLILVQW